MGLAADKYEELLDELDELKVAAKAYLSESAEPTPDHALCRALRERLWKLADKK